jgi:Protein of unknown function (DUF3047)
LEVIPMANVKMLVSLAMVIGLLAVGALCTGEAVIILDTRNSDDLLAWNKHTLSSSARWQVVDDSGDRVIKLRSDASSVSLEKRIVVDLRQTPCIEWEWKVTALPKGGHFAAAGSDDQAGQLLVTFPKSLFERRKVITYLWDSTAVKGTMADAPGPFFLHIRAVVVESGDSQLGQWILEKRNLLEDFRALFGSTPDSAIGLRIQLNSQHTRSEAEAFWRTIRFTSQ